MIEDVFSISVASRIGFGKLYFSRKSSVPLTELLSPRSQSSLLYLPDDAGAGTLQTTPNYTCWQITSPRDAILPKFINSVLPQCPLFTFSAIQHLLNQFLILISLCWNTQCDFCSSDRTLTGILSMLSKFSNLLEENYLWWSLIY